MRCREPGRAEPGGRPTGEAIISGVRRAGVFWAPASSLPSYRFTRRGYVRAVSQGFGTAPPPRGALPVGLPSPLNLGFGVFAMMGGEFGVCQAGDSPHALTGPGASVAPKSFLVPSFWAGSFPIGRKGVPKWDGGGEGSPRSPDGEAVGEMGGGWWGWDPAGGAGDSHWGAARAAFPALPHRRGRARVSRWEKVPDLAPFGFVGPAFPRERAAGGCGASSRPPPSRVTLGGDVPVPRGPRAPSSLPGAGAWLAPHWLF